jgi:hypothetical protein
MIDHSLKKPRSEGQPHFSDLPVYQPLENRQMCSGFDKSPKPVQQKRR